MTRGAGPSNILPGTAPYCPFLEFVPCWPVLKLHGVVPLGMPYIHVVILGTLTDTVVLVTVLLLTLLLVTVLLVTVLLTPLCKPLSRRQIPQHVFSQGVTSLYVAGKPSDWTPPPNTKTCVGGWQSITPPPPPL